MVTNKELIAAGLLSPRSREDAGFAALAALSSQLINRGAPRLTPTPPPIDLGAVMNAYNQTIQNDLQRGLAMRQFQRSEEQYKREQQEREALKAAFAPVMEPVTLNLTTADVDGAEMNTQRTVNMLMPSPLLRELPANLRQTITTAAESGFAGPALLQLIKSAQPRNFKRTYKQYVVPDGQGGETKQLLTSTDVFNLKQQGIEPLEYEKPTPDKRTYKQYIVPDGQGGQKKVLLTSTDVFNYKQQGIEPLEYERPFSENKKYQQTLAQGEDGKTYPARFNTNTGDYEILQNGKYVAMPSGMQIITKGLVGKSASTAKEFRTLRDEIIGLERGLGKLQSYMKNVKDAGQGYQRLAQSISTNIKTFFDSGKLTPAELAQQVAKGQLQGLLGAMRIETVGGGVMTEQDALRVINNLGGDVTALQNPQVVGQALKRLFEEKLARYAPAVRDYNATLEFTPRLAEEYPRRKIKDFDTSVFSPVRQRFELRDGKLVPVPR